MELKKTSPEQYGKNIKLDVVKRILEVNAFAHIGGSVALYLHGICLARINNGVPIDFDICVPFYTPLVGHPDDVVKVVQDDRRASDADYKEVLTFNGIKVDYRVAPAERWEIITYDGFDYRVTPLEIIMEAKFRYAIKGSKKHRDDCYEICGKIVPSTSSTDDALPF